MTDFLLRSVPESLHARLKRLCGKLGWTMRDAILEAIKKWVALMEKEGRDG